MNKLQLLSDQAGALTEWYRRNKRKQGGSPGFGGNGFVLFYPRVLYDSVKFASRAGMWIARNTIHLSQHLLPVKLVLFHTRNFMLSGVI